MTKLNGEGMMLPTKYANRREKILEQENPLVSFVCSVGGSVFLPVDEPASPMRLQVYPCNPLPAAP